MNKNLIDDDEKRRLDTIAINAEISKAFMTLLDANAAPNDMIEKMTEEKRKTLSLRIKAFMTLLDANTAPNDMIEVSHFLAPDFFPLIMQRISNKEIKLTNDLLDNLNQCTPAELNTYAEHLKQKQVQESNNSMTDVFLNSIDNKFYNKLIEAINAIIKDKEHSEHKTTIASQQKTIQNLSEVTKSQQETISDTARKIVHENTTIEGDAFLKTRGMLTGISATNEEVKIYQVYYNDGINHKSQSQIAKITGYHVSKVRRLAKSLNKKHGSNLIVWKDQYKRDNSPSARDKVN